jgi:geranylgeranyl reductase family protein
MNLSAEHLPAACDVLVVGAGPAGSAVAIQLARRGVDVVLVDQHGFPRDKVCGDALLPDAHAALKTLGMLRAVMAHARQVGQLRCVAPRGGRVRVPGTVAVLPRRKLDDLLCRAAVLAGARMVAPARFVEAVEEKNGVVVGARLRGADTVQEVRARWVVLATGAEPQALLAAGMCERPTPSGMALRGYVRNAGMAASFKSIDIVWHRDVGPGHGWIVPCGDGVFNIGAGLSHRPDGRADARDDDDRLRRAFEAFVACHAPAGELMKGGELLGELKGAPLRCSLEGARYSRPGLLVVGEAAGSTYAFTGEGIGKAMETGILAARALLEAGDDTAVRAAYASCLRGLKPRFDLYERARTVHAHPWLADLLVWRARKSRKLLGRLGGVLDETSNPGHIASLRGMLSLFTL